jgi:hypothetical protein
MDVQLARYQQRDGNPAEFDVVPEDDARVPWVSVDPDEYV